MLAGGCNAVLAVLGCHIVKAEPSGRMVAPDLSTTKPTARSRHYLPVARWFGAKMRLSRTNSVGRLAFEQILNASCDVSL
jgi:hypothetical protein